MVRSAIDGILTKKQLDCTWWLDTLLLPIMSLSIPTNTNFFGTTWYLLIGTSKNKPVSNDACIPFHLFWSVIIHPLTMRYCDPLILLFTLGMSSWMCSYKMKSRIIVISCPFKCIYWPKLTLIASPGDHGNISDHSSSTQYRTFFSISYSAEISKGETCQRKSIKG
jgi:hypothetical protein